MFDDALKIKMASKERKKLKKFVKWLHLPHFYTEVKLLLRRKMLVKFRKWK